jgi:plasmid maintenance system antidote protein VapI
MPGAAPDEATLPWSEFGAALRTAIHRAGHSSAQLATALGIPPAVVTELVAGRRAPRDELQVRLMEQLLGSGGALLALYEQTRAATDQHVEHRPWDPAGARAFLQRGEVRLSTLHRVGGLLLGGAGLLLLLPAMLGQALPQLFSSFFLIWRVDPIATGLLAAVIGICLAVPLWGYLLILEDLAGFFFTGYRAGAGDEPWDAKPRYNPRYSLTPLRLAYDEAEPGVYPQISDSYAEHLRIVIPDSPQWRKQFDDRITHLYEVSQPIAEGRTGDPDRLLYTMRLAASTRRTLASEVGKMEMSMIKHVLQVQIVVLRYLKAMLLVLITAVTVLVAASIAAADRASAADARVVLEQLLVVFLLWPPLAAGAVASPIRWIYRQNSGEHGQPDAHAALRNAYKDRRLVRFENAIVFLCIVATALGAAAAIVAGLHGVSIRALVLGAVVAAALWAFVKTSWWKGSLRDTPGAFFLLITAGSGRQ